MLPRLDRRSPRRTTGTQPVSSSSSVIEEGSGSLPTSGAERIPVEMEIRRPLSPRSASDAYDYIISKQPGLSPPRQLSMLLSKTNSRSKSQTEWSTLARSTNTMHDAAKDKAAQSIKEYLTSPQGASSLPQVPIPQLDYYPNWGKTKEENDFDAVKMLLDLAGDTKTNYFSQFIINCTTDLIEALANPSRSPEIAKLIESPQMQEHLYKQICFVRDALQHMEDVGNTLEMLHYSMRSLVEKEGLARGDREVYDYADRIDYMSPIIKPIAINAIQTLETQGSIWLPMDIRYGSPTASEEKLHFFIVFLHKDTPNTVEVSAYETNGAFDLSQGSSLPSTSHTIPDKRPAPAASWAVRAGRHSSHWP